jgi:hypothetical protein
VGLFGRGAKRPVCEMCGLSEAEGCGSVHKHVVQIREAEPSWLPSQYRAQAPGEYTWFCTRCSTFPAMKWPHDGGAWAGMMMHLGQAHYVGQLKGAPGQRIEMISVD